MLYRTTCVALGASQSVTITVQGLSRRYLLHVPNRASGAPAVPLVLVNTETMTGFSTLADRERVD